jgi:hypothetical protein
LLSDRHRNLTALQTRSICRLHALLRELIPGGGPPRIRADRAAQLLRRVRPDTAVAIERKHMAIDLLAEVRRLDRDITAVKVRITDAVAASETSLTELFNATPRHQARLARAREQVLDAKRLRFRRPAISPSS